MTNEEAIKELSFLWERMRRAKESGVLAYKTIMYYDGQYVEALDMAIKALEQQLCEDCISREVVKDMLTAEWTKYMPMELDINLSFVLDKINVLPSVTPSYNSIKTELKSSEDCISRAEALKHSHIEYDDDGEGHRVIYVEDIEDLPSVTPTRPHGEWIHFTDDFKDYVACSCCGYGEEGEVLLEDKTPFCPVCGADMREGETDAG